MSESLFLFYRCIDLYNFLDSTCKLYHTIFVFLCLTYFTKYSLGLSILMQTVIFHLFCGWVIFHIFLSQSSIDGSLHCFRVLALVNSASLNIWERVSVQIKALLFPDTCSGMGLLDPMIALIFSFLRNPHMVFHSGCTILHSTNSVQGFPFLHTLPNIYDFYIFWR